MQISYQKSGLRGRVPDRVSQDLTPVLIPPILVQGLTAGAAVCNEVQNRRIERTSLRQSLQTWQRTNGASLRFIVGYQFEGSEAVKISSRMSWGSCRGFDASAKCDLKNSVNPSRWRMSSSR
jgi:hypothetical protein